jgi:hypothetical protein
MQNVKNEFLTQTRAIYSCDPICAQGATDNKLFFCLFVEAQNRVTTVCLAIIVSSFSGLVHWFH